MWLQLNTTQPNDCRVLATRELTKAASVEQASTLVGKGTVILTDAADATSSGGSGNSPAILAELVRQGYKGTLLAPLVDPAAVEAAFAAGVGATLKGLHLGGNLDTRYTPLALDVKVSQLSDGESVTRRWYDLSTFRLFDFSSPHFLFMT